MLNIFKVLTISLRYGRLPCEASSVTVITVSVGVSQSDLDSSGVIKAEQQVNIICVASFDCLPRDFQFHFFLIHHVNVM